MHDTSYCGCFNLLPGCTSAARSDDSDRFQWSYPPRLAVKHRLVVGGSHSVYDESASKR